MTVAPGVAARIRTGTRTRNTHSTPERPRRKGHVRPRGAAIAPGSALETPETPRLRCNSPVPSNPAEGGR